MRFIYPHSLAVHAFLQSLLQSLDPIWKESFILLVKKPSIEDMTSSLQNLLPVKFFLCWGTDDNWIEGNQENVTLNWLITFPIFLMSRTPAIETKNFSVFLVVSS